MCPTMPHNFHCYCDMKNDNFQYYYILTGHDTWWKCLLPMMFCLLFLRIAVLYDHEVRLDCVLVLHWQYGCSASCVQRPIDVCIHTSNTARWQHLRSASCHHLFIPRHRRSMFIVGPFCGWLASLVAWNSSHLCRSSHALLAFVQNKT